MENILQRFVRNGRVAQRAADEIIENARPADRMETRIALRCRALLDVLCEVEMENMESPGFAEVVRRYEKARDKLIAILIEEHYDFYNPVPGATGIWIGRLAQTAMAASQKKRKAWNETANR